jgi:hypothetical protein
MHDATAIHGHDIIDPLFKLFYLSLKNISAKWTLTVPNWPGALSFFTIEFSERIPDKH